MTILVHLGKMAIPEFNYLCIYHIYFLSPYNLTFKLHYLSSVRNMHNMLHILKMYNDDAFTSTKKQIKSIIIMCQKNQDPLKSIRMCIFLFGEEFDC